MMSLKVRARVVGKEGVAAPWGIWLGLSVWAATVLLGFLLAWAYSRSSADAIRYAGMFSQLAGIGSVALGLLKLRSLFNRPLLREAFAGWLRRLAGREQRTVKKVTLETAWEIQKVLPVEAVKVAEDASLENKLYALQKSHEALCRALETHGKDTRARFTALRRELAGEQRTCGQGVDRVNQTLEEIAIGGLHLETAGLTTLALGTIMVSVPTEIAVALPI